MLKEEVTIGVHLNGKLTNILIVPDGHKYHLFLATPQTGDDKDILVQRPINLGSIVVENKSWAYEGDKLEKKEQKQIADYITKTKRAKKS